MEAKFCPKCKGKGEVMLVLGGEIGPLYKCKKCGFRSYIFPEKKIKIKENKKKK